MISSTQISWSLTRAASPKVEVLDQIESTNDWQLGRSHVRPLEIALSLNQTRGRGRMGRRWLFNPGDGLALSVVLPGQTENSAAVVGGGIAPSLTVGVALLRALHALGISEARLKWPNDIQIGRKKLAGVLCEARTDGVVVAGVGINVRLISHPLESQAISLEALLSDPYSRLDELVASFVDEIDACFGRPDEEQWRLVVESLSTLGQDVVVFLGDGGKIKAKAISLGKRGELIVELPDGSQVAVTSSDIEHLYQ